MSELHDRLEKLARRGNARGADAVLAEAGKRAERGALAPVEDADDATPRSRDGVAVVSLEPAIARKRRRTGALVTAGGVAASLFVGVLAIGSLVGKGGGADSPEGAVRQLAAAVSHEDPLAAADVLAPEEVRSLHGVVGDASKRAQELSLAESASAPLTGLDLSVDNLNLSTENLADGYAKVSVAAGTISARTDNAKFSPLMQRVLRNSRDATAQADLGSLARSVKLPTFVMTVQHDGHWYVSAAYTALEYIREINQLPAADFGSGLRATATLGADSPDAAVTDAMHALAAGDWQKLIALAPPDEIPVYDYRAALTQLAADTKTSFTIDKINTTATVDGDTAKVTLKASGTSGPDTSRWSVDGSCFLLRGQSSATAGLISQDAGTFDVPLGTCGVAGSSITVYGLNAPGNGASAQISAVRENGRWFVSPVGTVLDLVDHAVASLTRRELYFFLNSPQLLDPDGALTLGRPVTLTRAQFGIGVYSFAGHQGEHLLGLASTGGSGKDTGFETQARVFGPDGKELDSGYGVLQGQALTLPTDGTYTFVFETYGNSDATVTIWDEAQAPPEAKNPPFPAGASCTYTAGAAPCIAPAVIPPTSMPSNPSQSSSATSSTVPGG